jgi:Uma2 family endonuclease
VTEAEFFSLPESKESLELIDGEVIRSPAPLPSHQVLVRKLASALGDWSQSHPPAFVGGAPLDVRLAPGRVVKPDLFLVLAGVTDARRLVDGTPDLVVEVLGVNRSYDRLTKRIVYSDAGVTEYWVVDPEERVIELVSGLQVLAAESGHLHSRVAEGFGIDAADLFTAAA